MPTRCNKGQRPSWGCQIPATIPTRSPPRSRSSLPFLICIAFLAFCCPVTSFVIHGVEGRGDRVVANTEGPAVPSVGSQLGGLGEIVTDPQHQEVSNVDRRQASKEGDNENDNNNKDDNGGDEKKPSSDSPSTTSAPPSKATSKPTTTTTASTESSSTTAVTATSSTTPDRPMPTAFDSNISTNFTSQGCPAYFQSLINNSTFQDCYAVSTLLENSSSFFEDEKSFVLISRDLDAACSVDIDKCTAVMSELAEKFDTDDTCGAELKGHNSLVLQAHNSFLAYKPVFKATCLKSPDTNNYCFADAVTNTSSPQDQFVYLIALGLNLPPSSRPTCNSCLQATMNVYADAAKEKDQPITNTYASAAQQINIACGPSFAPIVDVGSKNSGISTRRMVGSSGRRGDFILMGYVLLFSVAVPFLSGNL